MVSNEIKKAILAGVEAKALYLGNTLVWTRANVSPEPVPEGSFNIDIANFDLYEPGNTDRLKAPGTTTEPHDWSWHNAYYSANGTHGYLDCVEIKNSSEEAGGTEVPSIYIYLKPKSEDDLSDPWKSCLVYSKKMFPKGRIDIRAKMMNIQYGKSTLWATSSTMTRGLPSVVVDSETHEYTAGSDREIKYLYEFDVVEYTPSNEGDYGTNRAMWTWQENAQSILSSWDNVDVENPTDDRTEWHGWQSNILTKKTSSQLSTADPLPWLFIGSDGKPHSLSAGFWYPDGNTGDWYLAYFYNICYDGNKVKGSTNGCYYFLKSYVTATSNGSPKVLRDEDASNIVSSNCKINSSDLHWIKYDPVNNTITEGSGLDGNSYFQSLIGATDKSIIDTPHSIGTGTNVNGNLKNQDIYISDWHTWSLEVTDDGIKYICDDYTYIDQNHSTLYPLLPTEDYSCGLILSTIRPADYVVRNLLPPTEGGHMIVSSISFTPQDPSSEGSGENSSLQN